MAVLFRCVQGHDWEDTPDSPMLVTGQIACPTCGSGPQLVPFPLSNPTDPQPIDGTLIRPAITPVSDVIDCTLVGDSGASAPIQPSSHIPSGSHVEGPPPSAFWPAIPGYEILGELGRGGMGVVYKAKQTALGRIVALKMILSGSQAGRTELARFHSEAQAVARLQHPNIVQIFEVGEHSEGGVSRPYMALEFVSGGSLAERLREPLTMADGARLVETLARAVHFAHSQGVIHRDLKPGNILLQGVGGPGSGVKEEGQSHSSLAPVSHSLTPKVTDFGLAKTLDADAQQQTHSGQVLGTPAYMAPEQATGSGNVGPHTDVYALGVILYQLVTGRLPFVAASAVDVMLQLTTQEPPPPSRFAPRLARDLETVILKCLEKDPKRRYESALALAEDLRCFLAHEPIQARPVGRAERAVRWVRRHPALTGLMALAVVSVLGLCGTLVVAGHARRQRVNQTRAELRTVLVRAHAATHERRWEEARNELSVARLLARGEDGLDDLSEELEELSVEVEGRLEAAATALKFQKARDEALFLATLASDPASAEQTVRRVRSALDLGGAADGACEACKQYLDENQLTEIRKGRYELLLVLADLTEQGRPGRSPEQARAAAAEALKVLDEAATLGFQTQAFHLRRARYLELAGQPSRAAEQRAAAAKLLPSNDLDFYLAGSEYYRRGDLTAAAESFAGSLRLRPQQFWPLYFLALCHVRQGELKAARDDLTNCLSQQQVVWIYLLRGFVEGQMGRYGHADADFREALSLLQKQAGAGAKYVLYNNRAVTNLGLKQYAAAEDDLRKAIELEPEQYQAHVTLSQVYLLQKKQAEAKAELDRAIAAAVRQHKRQELDGDTLVLLYRSRYRLLLDMPTPDLTAALADLQSVIDLSADAAARARASRERGHLFYRLGRLGDALTAYGLAVKLQPSEVEPQRWRGEVLLRLKRYEAAADGFSRYLAGGGKPVVSVFRGRALARLQLGEPQKAVSDFTLALGLQPDDPSLRAQRGRTYLACKAYQLAAQDFDEAIKRQPANLQAHQGRALARLQLGEPREAAEDAERSAALAPADARVLYAAAEVLTQAAEQLGRDTSEARAARERQQARAVELLQQALQQLPDAERLTFWRDTVRRDPALRPLRTHEGYLKLDRRHARAS